MDSLKESYKAFQGELGGTGAGLAVGEATEGSKFANMIGMIITIIIIVAVMRSSLSCSLSENNSNKNSLGTKISILCGGKILRTIPLALPICQQ